MKQFTQRPSEKPIKQRLQKMLFTGFFLCLLLPSFAQVKVTGVVTEESKQPLPGVSIVIKGTTQGTITDFDGKFALDVNEGESLVFSFIGFQNQTVVITSANTKLDIVMVSDVIGLDELVVIGYGTQRKGDVTSAVVSVKADDFTTGKIQDAAELIKGKVAGLSIVNSSGNPNDTSSIMLRGITTVLGNISPLILVDGIEGSLLTAAPENIASIDVLKDASAAAIYGTRGANGVIIITTKSGQRGAKSSLSYSSYLSVSDWFRKADFMDADDIAEGLTQYPDAGYDTDWLSEVSNKVGYKQNHSLNINGGTEKSAYAANFTYNKEQGVMRKSNRDEIKTQLDFSHYAMNDMLKLNINLLYSSQNRDNNNNDYAYRQAMIRNPSIPVYHEDGAYYEDYNRFQYYNPVAIQNELIGDTRNKYARMVGNITFEPIKGWKTNLMLSKKETEATSENYYSSKYMDNKMVDPADMYRTIIKTKGGASKSSNQTRSDNLELTSTYDVTLNQHHITALAGYSYLYNVYDGFNASNSQFASESYLYNSLGKGISYVEENGAVVLKSGVGSYKNDNTLQGYFGRVSYGFENKYNLMISLRHEGSSKFGKNYKYGNFPSASAGWTLSNEEFMSNLTWLDNLRIRAGFGITGVIPTLSNDNGSYASLDLRTVDEWGYHQDTIMEWVPSIKSKQNANKDIRWEKTREYSFGIEWAVMNGRVSGTIDLYNKKTTDLLYNYDVPLPPNLTSITTANVGKMRNNGIEILLNVIPVRTSDFEWNSTLTMSHNKNKLLTLSGGIYKTLDYREEGGVGDPISLPTHYIEVGHNMGDFWVLKSNGVSKDGNVWVEVSDGEGGWVNKEFSTSLNQMSNRQRYHNGLPKVYAGWTNTFRYKKFDLNMVFTGQFGYYILNAQRSFYENNSIAYNRLKSAADYHLAVDENGDPEIYAPTGQQILTQLSKSMSQGVWSDHVEKGDFVKLTNVTLGYTLPITTNKYIQSLRMYVSGQNLFCITGYSGIDPEVSNFFRAPGIDDRDKYPTIRSFTMGLSVNF
ncbi:MAG TPA: SusC/RagA family TonB-linked outer membrane protein [Marinilabiliales bacterium]|nr:SusC/RagA family TonB-linked outer membrane protein [Marinilabiliales bacterium]HBO75134.1 SusC/RagA family TonB-linked outer membrane protein [Marinilabiliales bacterium]HBX85372.1 SusC/RagA family TonB-linked outer membrane protein [Marinilabiliales bacterium]